MPGVTAKMSPAGIELFLLLLLPYQAESVTVEQTQSRLVSVTDRVEMKCSHNDNDLYVMLWYQQRENQLMSLMGYSYDIHPPQYEQQFQDQIEIVRETRLRGALIIHSVNLSDSAVYFCAATDRRYTGAEAYFGSGTKLTILEPNRTIAEPEVKVFKPSKNECENKNKNKNKKNKKNNKTLVCLAYGFYPDHVSVFWQIDGDNITDGVATDNAALRDGDYYKITSRLRVPVGIWLTPGKRFTCTVNFFNGNTTVQRSNSVEGDGAKREEYLKITRTAKLSYAVFIAKSSIYGAFVVFIVWRLQGSSGKQND